MALGVTSISPLDTGILRRPPDAVAATAGEPGGKPSPVDGKAQPEAAPPPPPPPDLARVTEALDRFMRETSRSLVFDYDESSRRMIITVMDAETGEIVRQIPPDELLNLARYVAQTLSPPRLLDTRA